MRLVVKMIVHLAMSKRTVKLVISAVTTLTGRRKTSIKTIPTKLNVSRERKTVCLTILVSMAALTAFLNGTFVHPNNTPKSVRMIKGRASTQRLPLRTCVIFKENLLAWMAKTSKLIRINVALDAQALFSLPLLT
jgi:lysylphosphatidylglycerol synthetase-like protein (DUF2156 family)